MLSTPNMAQASLFSFFDSILQESAGSASAQENPHSFPHDTSILLAAALNSDPNPLKGTDEVIIDDDALMPSITPEGSVIVEGRELNTDIARYVVRKGDTLGIIAKMFGVSINTIRWANDLSSSVLREGQELLILPITGVRYTVKSGDTVATVAKKFRGNQEEIIHYNQLGTKGTLAVGEEIIIPDGVEASAVVPSSSGAKRSPFIASDSGPNISGYYVRPVAFGCPKTQDLHGHNGKDFGCPIGTPVMAAADGVVTIARGSGKNGGYGKMIVISHTNGTQTVYGHLSAVDVVPGERVVQGEVIAKVGNTGNSTGPHLHFEVRGATNPF